MSIIFGAFFSKPLSETLSKRLDFGLGVTEFLLSAYSNLLAGVCNLPTLLLALYWSRELYLQFGLACTGDVWLSLNLPNKNSVPFGIDLEASVHMPLSMYSMSSFDICICPLLTLLLLRLLSSWPRWSWKRHKYYSKSWSLLIEEDIIGLHAQGYALESHTLGLRRDQWFSI